MEQAARAPITAALFIEPCPPSSPTYYWSIDPRTRAHIDWTRSSLLEIADEYMDFAPIEMRRIMTEALGYIDAILPRLAAPNDRQQLLIARILVSSTCDSYPSLSLDEIAAELMTACRLLLTGTDYSEGDAPEDLFHGRA